MDDIEYRSDSDFGDDLLELIVQEVILAWHYLADDEIFGWAFESEGNRPMYTARSRGEDYTNELLSADHQRIYNVTRLNLETFNLLVQHCKDQGNLTDDSNFGSRDGEVAISVSQSVLIFLIICAQDMSYRMVAEVTSHSISTISASFHSVLEVLTSLHTKYVVDPSAQSPGRISDNPKFIYFEGCVGAIDGTHIPLSITKDDVNAAAYGNRKGFNSQNVLAVCDFDGNFTYVLPGWEGSAHDGKVLRDALTRGWGPPASGCYFLADAGYTNTSITLVPYRNTRYHLKEWERALGGPQNKEEYFNLRHAQLRNVIERAFGVLKSRFPILRTAQKGFSLRTQVRLVLALTCLHNMINFMGGEDVCEEDGCDALPDEDKIGAREEAVYGDKEMARKRDRIATEMWEDRKEILRLQESIRV